MLKKFWNNLLEFFSDKENPEEPIYDPLHLGGMIVGVIFTIGVLFWLFWTLLVYGGGIFVKIIPALQVLFTKKTLQDFGWVGSPYEMGIFEGWVANLIALLFLIALIIGIWKITAPILDVKKQFTEKSGQDSDETESNSPEPSLQR